MLKVIRTALLLFSKGRRFQRSSLSDGDALVFVFAVTFYQMRPLLLDSAALRSPSCSGHRFVFDFLVTKCSLLTKYYYSPQLIYFNSHSLSIPSLSLSSPSLLLLPSKRIFIAAFQIKVLPVRLTPSPSKMNADLSVQNRRTGGGCEMRVIGCNQLNNELME